MYIQVPRNGARARVTYLVSSHSRQDQTDLPPSGHPFPVNPRFHYLVSETPSSAWCLTACMTNHNTPPIGASHYQLGRGSTVAQFGLRTHFDLLSPPPTWLRITSSTTTIRLCRILGSPAIAERASVELGCLSLSHDFYQSTPLLHGRRAVGHYIDDSTSVCSYADALVTCESEIRILVAFRDFATWPPTILTAP